MSKYFGLAHFLVLVVIFVQNAGAANGSGDGKDGKVQWKKLSEIALTTKPLMMVPTLDGKLVFVLTHNKEVRVYGGRGQLQGKIPVGDGVSEIDVSPKGELLYLMDKDKQLISMLSVSLVVDIATSNSPYKGRVDAPVIIAVYSDFQ